MGKLQRDFVLLFLMFAFAISANGQVLINYNEAVTIEEDSKWFKSPEIARVTITVDEFPMSDLSITMPGDASLFIDGVMWLFSVSDTSLTIPLREIKQNFPSEKGLRELVIYKKEIKRNEISIKKGFFTDELLSSPVEEIAEIRVSRETSTVETFFFLAVLGVLFLISLFKVIYPVVLTFMLHPVLVFSTEDFSESNSITKFFTEEVLFFLVIFNMLLMLIIMISAHYLKVPVLDQLIIGDLNHMFLIWLLGTGVLLLISVLKFVWLKISALIFEINKIEFIHFFYMLRVASIILIGIYSCLVVCFTNDLVAIPTLIHYSLLGFFVLYILGILMLFFIMAKRVSLKNYHLFSYLCTAELVPFLVLSKLIIG